MNIIKKQIKNNMVVAFIILIFWALMMFWLSSLVTDKNLPEPIKITTPNA